MSVSVTPPCGPENPKAKGPVDSRYLEGLMEHLFLSEVLQFAWFQQQRRVDVLRPEVDISGCDLVLESDKRIRHLQLKGRWRSGNAQSVHVNARLRDHLDPCVVWIFWRVDPATCRVSLEYRYSPPSMWPSHSDGDSTFTLKRGHFLPGFLDIGGLMQHLFGDAASAGT